MIRTLARGSAALALVLSAALGAAGVTLPWLELAIAASVLLFGGLLVLAVRTRPALPVAAGLGLACAGVGVVLLNAL